jgi:hypothetical protein
MWHFPGGNSPNHKRTTGLRSGRPYGNVLSGLIKLGVSCRIQALRGKQAKLSPPQAVEARRVEASGSHNVWTIGSRTTVWSALRVGRPLPQEDSWYSFVRS